MMMMMMTYTVNSDSCYSLCCWALEVFNLKNV